MWLGLIRGIFHDRSTKGQVSLHYSIGRTSIQVSLNKVENLGCSITQDHFGVALHHVV